MMKAKIRILHDYQNPGREHLGEALRPGVIIDEAKVYDHFADERSAHYRHPATGSLWASYDGDFEILEVLD